MEQTSSWTLRGYAAVTNDSRNRTKRRFQTCWWASMSTYPWPLSSNRNNWTLHNKFNRQELIEVKRKTPRIYGVSRLHFLRLLMCSAKVHPGGFLLEITIFVSIFSWMHVLFITEKRLRIVKSDNFIIYFIRFFRFSMASLLKSLIGEFRKFQLRRLRTNWSLEKPVYVWVYCTLSRTIMGVGLVRFQPLAIEDEADRLG